VTLVDEVFIKINGKTHYLCRAVDQHGTVLDILVTSRRDAKAATRFFASSSPGLSMCPRVLVTDKLLATGRPTGGWSPAWSTDNRST
jgi:putative transposase